MSKFKHDNVPEKVMENVSLFHYDDLTKEYMNKYKTKWNKSILGRSSKKKYRQSVKGKIAAKKARQKYKDSIHHP